MEPERFQKLVNAALSGPPNFDLIWALMEDGGEPVLQVKLFQEKLDTRPNRAIVFVNGPKDVEEILTFLDQRKKASAEPDVWTCCECHVAFKPGDRRIFPGEGFQPAGGAVCRACAEKIIASIPPITSCCQCGTVLKPTDRRTFHACAGGPVGPTCDACEKKNFDSTYTGKA